MVAVVLVATFLALLVAGVGMAIGSGGSGSDGSAGDEDVRTVQPGAPGEEGRELTDEEAAEIEAPAHNPADTAFMQDMVVHHRQALDMTALVADRTGNDDLPLLAERITVSQEDEIAQVETWLTERGEDVPAAGGEMTAADHEHHASMPGMATPEQLAQLEAARDAGFDRLFLELMIAHHEGAIVMVDQLYTAGGGLEPAADRFAREVEADQRIEIDRMQELLG